VAHPKKWLRIAPSGQPHYPLCSRRRRSCSSLWSHFRQNTDEEFRQRHFVPEADGIIPNLHLSNGANILSSRGTPDSTWDSEMNFIWRDTLRSSWASYLHLCESLRLHES
jgi:hypothetical protein